MKRPEDTILRTLDKAIRKSKIEGKKPSKMSLKKPITVEEMGKEMKTKQKKKRSTYSGKQKVVLKDMLKSVKEV